MITGETNRGVEALVVLLADSDDDQRRVVVGVERVERVLEDSLLVRSNLQNEVLGEYRRSSNEPQTAVPPRLRHGTR